MNLKVIRLITIIAEEVLEEQIVQRLVELGATGYTVVESRGHGSADRHAGEIPGRSIRIEALVEPETAEAIAQKLAEEYFEHYSLICFITEAQVVRDAKYRK